MWWAASTPWVMLGVDEGEQRPGGLAGRKSAGRGDSGVNLGGRRAKGEGWLRAWAGDEEVCYALGVSLQGRARACGKQKRPGVSIGGRRGSAQQGGSALTRRRGEGACIVV